MQAAAIEHYTNRRAWILNTAQYVVSHLKHAGGHEQVVVPTADLEGHGDSCQLVLLGEGGEGRVGVIKKRWQYF